MTYYPPGHWPPPYPPPRQPSAGAAAITATLALMLAAYTAWPTFLLVDPLIGGCGSACFTGLYAVSLLGYLLAGFLLLLGGVLIFLRTVAGPVMTALGATVVLLLLMMAVVLAGRLQGLLAFLGLGLALPTLVMSLLPATFAWSRKPVGPWGY